MKVFLSWSGEKSKRVAEVLREWLPNVIQAIDPWLSSEDIEKGARWSSNVASQLDATSAGIICVTSDNQGAPWLNFEAGALSKSVEAARVCTYLLGLRPSDLKGPLVQFQATESTKEDTLRLVQTLNRALKDRGLEEAKLAKTFEVWWPDLEKGLNAVQSTKVPVPPQRSEREILEEILELVREQSKRPEAQNPPAKRTPLGKLDLIKYLEANPEVAKAARVSAENLKKEFERLDQESARSSDSPIFVLRYLESPTSQGIEFGNVNKKEE